MPNDAPTAAFVGSPSVRFATTVAALAVGVAAGALWVGGGDGRWASYAAVYDDVAPVVVNVAVEAPDVRVGSGFAVAPDRVVTARHLVVDATEVVVRRLDGDALPARVLGTDARTDLAVLEVPAGGLSPASLGATSSLRVGDTVLAIGNPYGLGHSLAVGVVGARTRTVGGGSEAPEVLQLTIPLNPGNSGGPIVDERGDVVGVLAGTYARGQAIAFAVPTDALAAALPGLMRGDRRTRAWLGARVEPDPAGARVVAVVPAGPAERAELRPGDVVTSLAGRPVADPDGLAAALDALGPSKSVPCGLVRDGQPLTVDVTLDDRADRAVVISGMTLRASPGTGGEVVAVRPGSRAERAGVRVGDVVKTVGGRPVQAPADVQDLLAGRGGVTLEVLRDDNLVGVALEPLS